MVVAISIVLGIAALLVMAVAYASCIVAKETDEAMESQRVRVRRVASKSGTVLHRNQSPDNAVA
jgi:hypothetical protein